MIIAAGGNVGIGTTTPRATFDIVGTVAGAAASRVFLPAQAFNFGTADYPTFYTRSTGSVKYELQFSGTADQICYTTIMVPSNFSGKSITFKLYWYTTTANQPIVWDILVATTGDGGSPNPSLSLLNSIVSSTNTAGTLKMQTFEWNENTTSQYVANVYAGQIFYIAIRRPAASNSSDTSTETINFHSLIVEF